jgi:hypothetical protein
MHAPHLVDHHARNQDCCVIGNVTTVYLMAFA